MGGTQHIDLFGCTFTVSGLKDLIDHVNGVVDDNRINNLREATNHENQQNRKTTAGRGPFSLGTRYREDLKEKVVS